MNYPSGKSLGVYVLIWGLILLFIGTSIYFVLYPSEEGNYVIIGCVLMSLLMLWIWFAAYYASMENYLLARMGPFFERIPYARITSARRFRGMPSSMSLSIDMLELRHGKYYITGTTYISPRDQQGFLEALKAHCPNLVIKD